MRIPGFLTPERERTEREDAKLIYCWIVGARLCQSLDRMVWVRFSLRSNICSGVIYLRAACQEPWVSHEGLHHWLVIVRLVKQHLCMTLRPARPIGGDIGRVDVVVGVKKYHGWEERLLERLLEGRIVERRVTKAAKKKKQESILSDIMKWRDYSETSYDRSSACTPGGIANSA